MGNGPLSVDGTLYLDRFLSQINRNHCLIHDHIVTFHLLLVVKHFYVMLLLRGIYLPSVVYNFAMKAR